MLISSPPALEATEEAVEAAEAGSVLYSLLFSAVAEAATSSGLVIMMDVAYGLDSVG